IASRTGAAGSPDRRPLPGNRRPANPRACRTGTASRDLRDLNDGRPHQPSRPASVGLPERGIGDRSVDRRWISAAQLWTTTSAILTQVVEQLHACNYYMLGSTLERRKPVRNSHTGEVRYGIDPSPSVDNGGENRPNRPSRTCQPNGTANSQPTSGHAPPAGPPHTRPHRPQPEHSPATRPATERAEPANELRDEACTRSFERGCGLPDLADLVRDHRSTPLSPATERAQSAHNREPRPPRSPRSAP